MSETYYVKSFEEDFATKTLKDNEKVTFQKIEDVIETGKIRPNTKSFGQEMRLSTTILNENYTKTYRPQGIIFETKEKPDYILPFDLVLLSDTDDIVVHYYRIKDKLHIYYNHKLIDGYEKFVFDDFTKMTSTYSSPKAVWEAVNKFRIEKGHKQLPKTKYRLVEYNEAVFLRDIEIKPIAIFGYTKEAREYAKKFNLKHFKTARDFYLGSIGK